MVRLVVALLCLGGILAVCAPAESRLQRAAADAARNRFAAEATELREVRGERESAVCGKAGGQPFVYRDGSLKAQADLGDAWPAFWAAWCEA